MGMESPGPEGETVNLIDALKSRQRDSIYIPVECQVHSCRKPSVAYCDSMYIFVCADHVAEFCTPEGHRLYSIEEGLLSVISGIESHIRSSEHYTIRLKADLKKYQDHLASLKVKP